MKKPEITRLSLAIGILSILFMYESAEGEIRHAELLFATAPVQQPSGAYSSHYPDGQPREKGQLVKGIPDGEWKGWYSNGQPSFIRTYSADKLERITQEIRKHPRHIFTPLALQAKADPSIFSKAVSSRQSFSDLYGKTRETTPPVSQEPAQDTLSGAGGWQAEQPYTPPFDQCLHHGLYMNFYPNGQTKDSGFYKNGLREGHWIEWLDKGRLRASGAYLHGSRTGTWSYHEKSGRLRSLATYNKKGELSQQKFYE